MGTALLIFAVVMGCVALAVTLYCLVTEASEAWQISHQGWTKGHRPRH